MKKALLLVLATVFILTGCSMSENSLMVGGDDSNEEFYEAVSESQELLDDVADDIYNNWHGAIYNDEFGGDIDVAIYAAQLDHSDDIKKIKSNDSIIKDLYKKVRDGKLSDETKDVMQAYNEYYEFVINVSGSFNSYSANKETLKKALSSALKNLEMEI